MSHINISGLDKAAVLAALWNRANPPLRGSMAMLHYRPSPMSLDEASAIIEDRLSGEYATGLIRFDYLLGKSFKLDLTEDTVDAWLYDRDHGDGAAQRAIDELRGGFISNPYRVRNPDENRWDWWGRCWWVTQTHKRNMIRCENPQMAEGLCMYHLRDIKDAKRELRLGGF